MIVRSVAQPLRCRPFDEMIVPTDQFESGFPKLSLHFGWISFVVQRFESAGFFLARQRVSIEDNQSAPWVKCLEGPLQNGPGMHELVVGVRHKHSIELAFLQMRVVRLTVKNLNVPLMAQEGSDPEERQWLSHNVLRNNKAFVPHNRPKLEREIARPRTDIGDDAALFEIEGLNRGVGLLPAVALSLDHVQHFQGLNGLKCDDPYDKSEANSQEKKRDADAVGALDSAVWY